MAKKKVRLKRTGKFFLVLLLIGALGIFIWDYTDTFQEKEEEIKEEN